MIPMSRFNKETLMIGGAVVLSLLGLGNLAAWLLQQLFITPEVKGLLFIGWLFGVTSSLPHPFDTIATIAALVAMVVLGGGAVILAGRIWYSITHALN